MNMRCPPRTEPHRRAHLLAAAGLLHDVGKAGEPAEVELHPTIANLEQQICPSGRSGSPQYRHVLYTAQLLHEAQELGCDFGGLDRADLFRLAAYHHQRYPDTLDDCLLKKADWLASGHDRREVESGDATASVVTGLWPILASLAWPHQASTPKPAAERQVVPTCPLSFEEATFLPRSAQDRSTYRQGCREVWAKLREGIAACAHNMTDYVDRMAALAQATLNAIPASRSFGQQADVALCDHSHVVAAFAACLAILHDPAGPNGGVRDPNKVEGRYRLLGLGLGRIQQFILRSVPPLDEAPGETAEKGMARRLRARSFYISLLT